MFVSILTDGKTVSYKRSRLFTQNDYTNWRKDHSKMKICDYCRKPIPINIGQDWHDECRLTYCEDLLARLQDIKHNVKGLPRKVWVALCHDNFLRDPNSPEYKVRILTREELELSRKKTDENKVMQNICHQIFGSPKK